MRQHDEKLQVNSVSHILLNMEMKADDAVLGIPTGFSSSGLISKSLTGDIIHNLDM
jgi:hypothetical protein